MQANESAGESACECAGPDDSWVSDLRHQLVDCGFDPARVDTAITTALERFRTSRIHDFIPLLVERAASRALRGFD